MLPLTLTEIAAACGGRLEARDPDLVITRVTTDSRDVREGDLYLALRGERFDGDDFAADAIAAGAAGVVVRQATASALRRSAARIAVDDGLAALGGLAAAVRRRSRARVVAITGSAGKTSTKDILAALLRPLCSVVATAGNFNNEIGVPLTVLEIEADTQVLVCELAMRGRGEIGHLARIIAPDVGVITNIAPVHLEFVGSIAGVAAAKAELIAELGSGTLVVPFEEKLLEPYLRLHPGRLITFGHEDANVMLADARQKGFETRVLVDAFGRRVSLEFAFSGGHYLHDALAALGAFLALGFGLEDAKLGARQVVFSDLRGKVVPLTDDGLLLNDAYNANPLSMKAALEHLVSVAGGRPPVAFLGDMYELGPDERVFHREVGAFAASLGVRVVAVGGLAHDYLTGASDELWFATTEECLAALPGVWTPGSAALVKASRALRLERVADAIVAYAGHSPDAPLGEGHGVALAETAGDVPEPPAEEA